MPLQATSGAASYDAFGGGVPVEPNYIESVFSTFLYTGNGSTQTITNGIDLAGEGGLVWIKSRSQAEEHGLVDTVRGRASVLRIGSNSTAAAVSSGSTNDVTAFNSDGFSLGTSQRFACNDSGSTYASWTFRKQPKFFDVVTYTGNGTARTIAHNLGSVPGCIIIKVTSADNSWFVYHRSLNDNSGNPYFLQLNSTAAQDTGGGIFSTQTSTTFGIRSASDVNQSGQTYVAYLFAHNAGGFGLTGTDNVISCGSFTTDGSGNASVNLGYEPQWAMWKRTDSTSNWSMVDNMRGWGVTNGQLLSANTSNAESANNPAPLIPNATGFSVEASANATYIYIAIRRGPMKVPTTGASVFSPVATSSSDNPLTVTTNFPVDILINRRRLSDSNYLTTRLIGSSTTTRRTLNTDSNSAEFTATGYGIGLDNNTAAVINDFGTGDSTAKLFWLFRRAPGFFDVVCYTGDGTTSRNVNHNLGVVPEMVIVKSRSNASTNWVTGVFANGTQSNLWLNSTAADGSASSGGIVFTQFSNSTTFRLSAIGGVVTDINTTSATYVAYLFASAPGVSKVFSYTGNGSSQTINCGFTGGARFVMVKRTDSTGNWLVVDTARGLVSAGDPTLYLNSTAAEVTGVDWIDPDNSGFIVNQEGTMNANVSSATYIGLAIA